MSNTIMSNTTMLIAPLQEVQPELNTHLWVGGNYLGLVTMTLTPLQFNFLIFIFLSLGLTFLDIKAPIKIAAQQNVPHFMSQPILNDLHNYKVKYSIVIHNRFEDSFTNHASAFIQWKSRQDMNIKANLHIYPSREIFYNGDFENRFLNHLTHSMMEDNAYIPSTQVLDNWEISPVLKFFSRGTGKRLDFYIKHLFENRHSPNWQSEDSTNLGAKIIDLRGYVLNKINDYTVGLNSYNNEPIDIYSLPESLENFIDVLNESWLPILF